MVRWCWVNFQCRGVLLIWIRVGPGPSALAVGAGGGCVDGFSLVYHFSFLSPSLWTTAQYRLKYCLTGLLSPKQVYFVTFILFLMENPVSNHCRPDQMPHYVASDLGMHCSPMTLLWFQVKRGWSGGAMVLGKFPVPGRPTNLDQSRARAFCACSRCGWGLCRWFFSRLSFLFSFSLSLDDSPI